MLCLARIFQRFELRLDAERHTGPLDLRSSECEICRRLPIGHSRMRSRCSPALLAMTHRPRLKLAAVAWVQA